MPFANLFVISLSADGRSALDETVEIGEVLASMGMLKLESSKNVGDRAVSGRQYFRRAAEILKLASLDPVAIQSSRSADELKSGARESRVGGRIARNLKHLTPAETAERRRRSEHFLKQPDAHFPAEDKQRRDETQK